MCFSVVVTLAAFVSVIYTGCKKATQTPSVDLCASVTCQNGGSCYKGICTCPAGYEGENCETKSNKRYIGNWEIKDKVVGSSKSANIGKKNAYEVSLSAEGNTTTTLRMKGFLGNANYGDVLLRLGLAPNKVEVDGRLLELDNISLGTNFVFIRNQAITNTYIIVEKGNGNVNGLGTFISGTCYMLYQDTTGPVHDTLSFTGVFK